ncbi:D-serine ammonia-lyase [Sporolactobacillus sp. THM7-7]|nr:D-serine ammonia-lyase [Sporolactobacillus sp. THM7-7]
MASKIGDKTLEQWVVSNPILKKIMAKEEVLWLNPKTGHRPSVHSAVTSNDVEEAEKRLQRFAPYIETVFPETRPWHGLIESRLVDIPKMKGFLEKTWQQSIPGRLLMKNDSHLPISGSIKARGGIYEVLNVAEQLAIRYGLLEKTDNYAILADESFREFFSKFTISVGSTGNLGLSVGIMGAKLGFRTVVHMSKDAKTWKKDLLREKGVEVREFDGDYSLAVKEGRRMASLDDKCHFIDDENSKDLFVGYATSGNRLKQQFADLGIVVNEGHPLFVYLPCGVGGGPGGITFGLKRIFGRHVHVFFVEPTHAPCFLLGLLTGLYHQVSVMDFGLDNQTDADGLAVPRSSAFAGEAIGHLVSGCLTIEDDQLFRLLKGLKDSEGIPVEPSAAAGFIGPVKLFQTEEGRRYIKEHNLTQHLDGATHLVWTTGGSMVPDPIREAYYRKAEGK